MSCSCDCLICDFTVLILRCFSRCEKTKNDSIFLSRCCLGIAFDVTEFRILTLTEEGTRYVWFGMIFFFSTLSLLCWYSSAVVFGENCPTVSSHLFLNFYHCWQQSLFSLRPMIFNLTISKLTLPTWILRKAFFMN